MKISEINISPAFISMCVVIIGVCMVFGFITENHLFYLVLSIWGVLSFVVIDLCQMILSKELFAKEQQEGTD